MADLRSIMRGTAIGDAWGYRNEFRSRRMITMLQPLVTRFPRRATVSDDTQMSLEVAYAVRDLEHRPELSIDQWQHDLTERFVAWSISPLNNRAPGVATMAALKAIRRGVPVRDAAVADSKGCGTIMRAAPLGMISDAALRTECAVAQSLITHGHPMATLGSIVVAHLAAQHLSGQWFDRTLEILAGPLPDLPGLTQARDDLVTKIHADGRWDGLGDLSDRYGSSGSTEDVLLSALGALEALVTRSALRQCARSGGDSDSIGAVAGGLAGSASNLRDLEDLWANIEPHYRDLINIL